MKNMRIFHSYFVTGGYAPFQSGGMKRFKRTIPTIYRLFSMALIAAMLAQTTAADIFVVCRKGSEIAAVEIAHDHLHRAHHVHTRNHDGCALDLRLLSRHTAHCESCVDMPLVSPWSGKSYAPARSAASAALKQPAFSFSPVKTSLPVRHKSAAMRGKQFYDPASVRFLM
jgi:hypothetical protein